MPRDRESLFDILEAAALVIEEAGGKTVDDILSSASLQAIICFRFIVIGEAAARLSDATAARYPQLPLSHMRRMRNVITHEYDDVDFGAVMKTVREDLPPLVVELERILSEDWPTD